MLTWPWLTFQGQLCSVDPGIAMAFSLSLKPECWEHSVIAWDWMSQGLTLLLSRTSGSRTRTQHLWQLCRRLKSDVKNSNTKLKLFVVEWYNFYDQPHAVCITFTTAWQVVNIIVPLQIRLCLAPLTRNHFPKFQEVTWRWTHLFRGKISYVR